MFKCALIYNKKVVEMFKYVSLNKNQSLKIKAPIVEVTTNYPLTSICTLPLSLTHLNSHSHTSASPTQTHHLLYGCIYCRSWVRTWNEIEMLPEDESLFECLRVCERDGEFVLVALNLFNIRVGGMKSGKIRGNNASRIVWWWTWIMSIHVLLRALFHLRE